MPDSTTTPCCGTCPHARRLTTPEAIGQVRYGCKRFPPQIVVLPTANGPEVKNLFPVLGQDDCCDEHPAIKEQMERDRKKIFTQANGH